MKIPFLAWIFQGIPECIGIAALFLSLDAKPLNWRIFGMIGFLQAIVAYVIRLMPFTPGVHIFILPISVALLGAKLGRVRLDRALIYAVTIAVMLSFWEITIFYLSKSLGIIDFPLNMNNLLIRIIIGMPQVILLFLTAFFIQKRKLGDKLLKSTPFALHDK